ncbi:hemagglutinin [Neorhizobium lilium]|uniref:Hemagglutinin n=1 Tax=Neorhizobium lilium TaxID=2503024 RepID=A0A3S3RG66_9HYPH|nr:peptidoglycan-binding protein [Neorhizobium lilium]RWX76928.1 hemagglutinin [Neorhizobium lilium]
MNGSRATSKPQGGTSSIDALSRTIEGLEARIEGLMGAPGRETKPQGDETLDRRDGWLAARTQAQAKPVNRAASTTLGNPLAAIRERQRMLDTGRTERETRADVPQPRVSEARYEPTASHPVGSQPNDVRRPDPRREPPRPVSQPQAPYATVSRPARPAPRAPIPTSAPASDASMREIADALVNLRQQLKQDISEGVAREMSSLRAEIRSIKSIAEEQHLADDLRGDLSRLADSINQLGQRSAPEALELRQEFEELREAMGGLAREDSIRRMEDHWRDVEGRIQEGDSVALRDELVSLAYRIEDIKGQLGAMADNPVIHALEQKLITVASAMEQLGSRMQPNDQTAAEQFALLDERLDEISRAIAAGSRATAAATIDQSMMQRLEGRIGSIAEQIDHISHAAAAPSQTDMLSQRIEALAGRMEELAEEQAAMRLEERLDQLSALLQQTQRHSQPDLGGYLADISHKIDGLQQGSVSDVLAERLDYLATRIDELEFQPRQQQATDDATFGRIEDRLSDIAARLDEAAAAPRSDDEALRSLEDQIAHLSSLISYPAQATIGMSPELDTRLVAIENYMATSDEYIIEAARQAAEAVVEAYSHNIGNGASIAPAEMAALAGLADDLRHLEDLTRSSEERTHHTFEALHTTLVQIADRLDSMDHRFGAAPAPAMPAAAPLFVNEGSDSLRQEISEPETSTRAKLQSSAAYAVNDETLAFAESDMVAAPAKEETKAPKTSLLQELSRRFRPGARDQAAQNASRVLVDPAPSLDPSEALPLGRENDLLEPGTGAPDVKKILERVRASQASGEFGPDRTNAGDRADYIAAARRAAKAAAQETDPSQTAALKGARKAAQTSLGKTSTETVSGGRSLGATFSQHRRPILMAVGAVLLALMAVPLVKTFNAPANLAPPDAVVAPAQPQASAEPRTPASMDEAPAAPAVSSETGQAPAPEATGENGVTNQHLTDPQPADGQAAAMAPAGSMQPAPDSFAAPKAEARAPIVVPAGIAPKSLSDAAASGDANALYQIGIRYTEGRGVQTDLAEAAKWYKLAADEGLPPAQYRYANLLEKGTGIPRDINKAADYYRKAAEAGNASAMHNLAVLYASGATGQPDYPLAVQWFSRAADLGVADSQFNLAILYARGNGVKQDLEESYKWFAVAAENGDKDAAQKREEVAKAMRKEQLDSARTKVSQWQVKTLDPKANAVNIPDEWAASGKPLTTASIDMEKAIRNVQAILNKNGFDVGTADGKLGQKTVAAIKAFQTSVGQEPNGKINDALVKALLARNT